MQKQIHNLKQFANQTKSVENNSDPKTMTVNVKKQENLSERQIRKQYKNNVRSSSKKQVKTRTINFN